MHISFQLNIHQNYFRNTFNHTSTVFLAHCFQVEDKKSCICANRILVRLLIAAHFVGHQVTYLNDPDCIDCSTNVWKSLLKQTPLFGLSKNKVKFEYRMELRWKLKVSKNLGMHIHTGRSMRTMGQFKMFEIIISHHNNYRFSKITEKQYNAVLPFNGSCISVNISLARKWALPLGKTELGNFALLSWKANQNEYAISGVRLV